MAMQVFNPSDGPFYLSDGSVIDGHGWKTVEEDVKVSRALASGRLVAVDPVVHPEIPPVPEDTTDEEPVDEETASPTDTMNEASDDEPKE